MARKIENDAMSVNNDDDIGDDYVNRAHPDTRFVGIKNKK